MSAKPCLTCGEVSDGSYCEEHQPATWHHRKGSGRQRGYDAAWDKLSKRARALQPFCSWCSSTEDLTTDHKAEAWERKAEVKPIRLSDVRVLCSACDVRAGSSRPENQGEGSPRKNSGPRGKAQSPLLSSSLPVQSDLSQDLYRANVGLHLVGEHDHFACDQHVAESGGMSSSIMSSPRIDRTALSSAMPALGSRLRWAVSKAIPR